MSATAPAEGSAVLGPGRLDPPAATAPTPTMASTGISAQRAIAASASAAPAVAAPRSGGRCGTSAGGAVGGRGLDTPKRNVRFRDAPGPSVQMSRVNRMI